MIYQKGTLNEATGILKVVNGVLLSATAAYRGDRLYWAPARSCYGTGVWLPDRPWIDTDKWKDNK